MRRRSHVVERRHLVEAIVVRLEPVVVQRLDDRITSGRSDGYRVARKRTSRTREARQADV